MKLKVRKVEAVMGHYWAHNNLKLMVHWVVKLSRSMNIVVWVTKSKRKMTLSLTSGGAIPIHKLFRPSQTLMVRPCLGPNGVLFIRSQAPPQRDLKIIFASY